MLIAKRLFFPEGMTAILGFRAGFGYSVLCVLMKWCTVASPPVSMKVVILRLEASLSISISWSGAVVTKMFSGGIPVFMRRVNIGCGVAILLIIRNVSYSCIVLSGVKLYSTCRIVGIVSIW